MQNTHVQNSDVSGLEDKHSSSLTSDSISWPQCLSFAIPVPEEADSVPKAVLRLCSRSVLVSLWYPGEVTSHHHLPS